MVRFLVWAILVAFASSAHAQPNAVAVFLEFDQEPSAASIAEMKKEASAIFKASGVVLDWWLVKENRGDESFHDLAVMRFKGSCRAERLPSATGFDPAAEESTLASTVVAGHCVLPFSEVECDHVRGAVANVQGSQRESILGRALGRVVAHELYHVLTQTTTHARRGLAKPFHTWEDLTSKGLDLMEGDRAILLGRRGLSR
jgi:hypothetical protein